MPLAIWLDYNTSSIQNPDAKWSKWYFRLAAATLVFIIPGTIAYSRLFLGVHALNQVFYGLSLGAWFAISSELILRERMIKLIKDLIDLEETRVLHLFAVGTVLAVAASGLQILNYSVVKTFVNKQLWKNQITRKCGADELEDAFQARGLLDYGQDVCIIGSFWGVLL